MEEAKLKVERISKSFPGVRALENITLSVKAGTVHVLCGENGAGKSTLMKIINGVYQSDGGEILIDGVPVHIRNPIQARKAGISMIFQELNYIPELTVEESLFTGCLPTTRFGRVDWKEVRRRTVELLEKENLPYRPDQKIKDLTVSDVQMLEILKAVSHESSIIIMDEPTSAITQREVERLFQKIEDLKRRGTCVIYISHKMDEIFRIADEITVLRDGSVVATKARSETDIDEVISLMVGRKLDSNFPKERIDAGAELLEVRGLRSAGTFKNIDFSVREGEIVGFAGLVGAGRTEVMRALFGLDPYDSGEILIRGKRVAIRSVKDSLANRMTMLSEDRRRYGIIPVRSVRENVTISSLGRFIRGGRLRAKEEQEAVSAICARMSVKTPSLETVIESLSGGNQQKVLLAKWMLSDPDILILDEPTRGIDVGAKYEIYKLMSQLAKERKGLIMVSSELPELIGMCDRIYVMCKGEIAGELPRSEFYQEAVMRLATGVERRTGVKA
jgi:inositol transport system ATP-binding protein